MNWRTLFTRRPDGRAEPYDQRAELAAYSAILDAHLTVKREDRQAKSERSKRGHSTGWVKRREQAVAVLGGSV